MSLPCSAKDCFMCQMENKEIKESFRFEDREKIRKRNQTKNRNMIFFLNIIIGIVFLLLVLHLWMSTSKKEMK
jgi:cell division septal protein FtsQ